MLGLDVIEVMTPSGHPSIINRIGISYLKLHDPVDMKYSLARNAKSPLVSRALLSRKKGYLITKAQ